jgi:hypothetical protein
MEWFKRWPSCRSVRGLAWSCWCRRLVFGRASIKPSWDSGNISPRGFEGEASLLLESSLDRHEEERRTLDCGCDRNHMVPGPWSSFIFPKAITDNIGGICF